MTNITGYPLCRNEGVKYFETGEKFFKDVKEELARQGFAVRLL